MRKEASRRENKCHFNAEFNLAFIVRLSNVGSLGDEKMSDGNRFVKQSLIIEFLNEMRSKTQN